VVKIVRKGKRAPKGLTKTQRKQVKALVVAPAETKYVAEQAVSFNGALPIQGFSVPSNLISGGAGLTAWTMIPRTQQGPGAQDRIGNRVTNVTLRTDFQFWLNPNIAGLPTADYTVIMYIIKPKLLNTNSSALVLPANNFFDNGTGARFDYISSGLPIADKSVQMFPVNKEQFTVLKKYKFRLAKNQDAQTNGIGAGCSPNLAMAQTRDFSYTYKHKGTLIYPTPATGLSQVPENLSLMAFACVWDTNAAVVPALGAVLCNSRSHMYYKDL